jgi:hypothetical protein
MHQTIQGNSHPKLNQIALEIRLSMGEIFRNTTYGTTKTPEVNLKEEAKS